MSLAEDYVGDMVARSTRCIEHLAFFLTRLNDLREEQSVHLVRMKHYPMLDAEIFIKEHLDVRRETWLQTVLLVAARVFDLAWEADSMRKLLALQPTHSARRTIETFCIASLDLNGYKPLRLPKESLSVTFVDDCFGKEVLPSFLQEHGCELGFLLQCEMKMLELWEAERAAREVDAIAGPVRALNPPTPPSSAANLPTPARRPAHKPRRSPPKAPTKPKSQLRQVLALCTPATKRSLLNTLNKASTAPKPAVFCARALLDLRNTLSPK